MASRKKKELSEEQIERFKEDRAHLADAEAKTTRQWVAQLEDAISHIVTHGLNADWPYPATFWVRLYALVAELLPRQLLRRETFSPWYDRKRGLREFVELPIAALETVRAALSRDEWIYAEYRRTVDAHLYQRGYSLEVRRDRTFRETYTSKLFGEHPVEYFQKSVRLVVAKHRSELAIAIDFATRMQKPVHDLRVVLESQA